MFLITASLLGGCASIVNGQNQSLSVEARSDAGPVIGATCKLTNDRGEWFVTSPGSTTVHRSYGDLLVKCEKDPLPPGSAAVHSSTKGMAFGNILLGGFIGAGVDMSTGAAYDYPQLITVLMGQNQMIPPPAGASAPLQTAVPAAATPSVSTAASAAAS
jgi:hypothetical protein